MPLVLRQIEAGPMQNFCYLIGDTASKRALLVDPAWAPKKLLETTEQAGFTLAGLLITHAHYDHVNGIDAVLEAFDVPVYANAAEADYARTAAPLAGPLGSTLKPVRGGDMIELGESRIECLHTPGHTPGSQCYRAGDHLITGDTLFIGGCGRSDLPGGDAETLFKSLRRIATLPGDLTVCPGHDYGPTRTRSLAEELRQNPYLGIDDPNVFLDAVGG